MSSVLMSSLPLGEVLVRAGLLSQVEIDDVVGEIGEGTRERLIGRALVERGCLSRAQLQAALAAQSHLRDGLDAYQAYRALGAASSSGETFEEALDSLASPRVERVTPRPTARLGELLLEAGALSRPQIEKAHGQSIGSGHPLGAILVREGLLTSSYVDAALELQIRVRDGMFSREQAVEALKQGPEKLLQLISPHLVSSRLTAPRSGETTVSADESVPLQRLKLGELFVRAGILKQSDVAQALELSLAHAHPIGEMLVARNFVSRSLLDAALSLQAMVARGQLSCGQATACIIKVFSSNKSVTDCLLELDLVKSSRAAATESRASETLQSLLPAYFNKASAGRTVSNLPAMRVSSASDRAVDRSATLAASATSETTAKESEPAQPVDQKSEYAQTLRQTVSRLGRAYFKRNELLAAEEMFEEALALSQKGRHAPSIVSDLSFLACLNLTTGKSWQSEKLLKRCLAYYQSRQDREHSALTLHRLALAYCHLGLLFKAEKHFKSAAELLQESLTRAEMLLGSRSTSDSESGEAHEITAPQLQRRLAAVYRDHAVLLHRMRRDAEADKYYFLSRKVFSSSTGIG